MRASVKARLPSLLFISILFIITLSFSLPSLSSSSSSSSPTSSPFSVILGVDAAAAATKTKPTAANPSTTAATTKKPGKSSTKSKVEKKPSKESVEKAASAKQSENNNEVKAVPTRESVAEPIVTSESQQTTLSEVLALVQSVSIQLLDICSTSAHTASEFLKPHIASLTAALQHAASPAAEAKTATHATGSIDTSASDVPPTSLATGSPQQEWDHFSDEAIWTLLCVGLVTVIVRDLLIR